MDNEKDKTILKNDAAIPKENKNKYRKGNDVNEKEIIPPSLNNSKTKKENMDVILYGIHPQEKFNDTKNDTDKI